MPTRAPLVVFSVVARCWKRSRSGVRNCCCEHDQRLERLQQRTLSCMVEGLFVIQESDEAGEESIFYDAWDHPALLQARALYENEQLFAARRVLEEHGVTEKDAARLGPLVEEVFRETRELSLFCADLNDENDPAYTIAVQTKRIIVRYRQVPGSVLHKYHVTAELNAPIENLCCVLAEPDLFGQLFWYVRDIGLLVPNGRVQRAVYARFYAPWPFTDRIIYLLGRGIDALDEPSESIYIVIRSVRATDGAVWRAAERARARQEHRRYVTVEARACFELHPLSRARTRVRLVGVFDPRIKYIPAALINWASRKIIRHGTKQLGWVASHLSTLPTEHWKRLQDPNWSFGVYPWLRRRLESYWREREASHNRISTEGGSRPLRLSSSHFSGSESEPSDVDLPSDAEYPRQIILAGRHAHR